MTPQQRFPAAFILFLTITVFVRLLNAGEVYLVIGSDTAIWDGMSVSRFHCTYNPDLYLNPDRNAYRVMEPEFRSGMVDSYGQPMKLTWWMMAGNIFRYATNTNIPVPNIMTLYLMKKYHGDNIRLNGDELTLHYHTFVWTDYDQNGIYFWNQAKSFLESLDDFNVTLAQFLIEEHVFPVSFRSGWHYMDNDWQHYLDERVLPFSMHNDYPAKRTEDPEPIDNIYDWSQAPSAFVPYHPSGANYQIPGDGPGWQVRSAHFWKARVNDYMDSVFIAAQNGGDQVVCFWGHLPENDFLDNLQVMNERAHQCEQKYPGVKFRYCTAIEAMQRWLKNTDAAAPNLQFTDEQDGDELYFHVESDKEIFQQQPFVAVKTIYEEYQVLDCRLVSEHHWRTLRPVSRAMVAKAAVTACDSLGNQAMEFIDYLPDDRFIDNGDEGYHELAGNWGTSSAFTWGNDSRVAQLQPEDTALVSWNFRVPRSATYNVFVQFPDISNRATRFRYRVRLNEQDQDTVAANDEWQPNRWYYLATVQAEQDDRLSVVLSASGQTQPYKLLPADVVRITPLVREKDIDIPSQMIELGAISVLDTVVYQLEMRNIGVGDLTISALQTKKYPITTDVFFPLVIPAMSSRVISVKFLFEELGTVQDTLVVRSDDPKDPVIKMAIRGEVEQYFEIIDNEDSTKYEEFGEWHYSVANVYGPTSRYAWLNRTPLASARFFTRLKKSGTYEIFEIVPTTVNSTDDALYQIKVDGAVVAAYHVDQNEGSGDWVSLGQVYLPAETEVEVRISDTGQSTKGSVIRTDAIRFSLIEEGTGIAEGGNTGTIRDFRLEQNFPNPFNAATQIRYYLPQTSPVMLEIFTVAGQQAVREDLGTQPAGWHRFRFRAPANMASGIYYYRLVTGHKRARFKKMIYVK